MTARSRVASLSKRTTDGSFRTGAEAWSDWRHVRPCAGCRGDEADDQVGAPLVVARDDQGWAAFVAGQVGEWKPGQDDAAEREHSAGLLHQVGVGVELRFVRQPIEGAAGRRDGGHW